jgi:hypothetical protein
MQWDNRVKGPMGPTGKPRTCTCLLLSPMPKLPIEVLEGRRGFGGRGYNIRPHRRDAHTLRLALTEHSCHLGCCETQVTSLLRMSLWSKCDGDLGERAWDKYKHKLWEIRAELVSSNSKGSPGCKTASFQLDINCV